MGISLPKLSNPTRQQQMFRLGQRIPLLPSPLPLAVGQTLTRSASTLKRLTKAGKEGDVLQAKALFEALAAESSPPPSKAYAGVMAAHLKQYDIDSAAAVADELLSAHAPTDGEESGTSLSGRVLEPVMKAMGQAGRLGDMTALLERARIHNLAPLPVGPVLSAKIKVADIDGAAALVEDLLVDPSTKVSQAWVRSVLDGYFGLGSVDGVYAMANVMDDVIGTQGVPDKATASLLQARAKSAADPRLRDAAAELYKRWFHEDIPSGGGGGGGGGGGASRMM